MKKIAVLISNAGTGTNLQAIMDAIKTGQLNAQIKMVISGSPKAYGLIRAKKNNIPICILKPNNKSTSQTQVEESQETSSNSTPGATAEPFVQEVGSISTSTDTKTIEKELNDTDLDSIDSDLESLEDSFDSL